MTDFEKLHGEVLRDELQTYRKLENWGVSLFLGAIVIISKQLAEWGDSADVTRKVVFDSAAYALPALVGIVAFMLLRIVNFRARNVSDRLFCLAGILTPHRPYGVFAWFLSAMPLVLGFASSWYFTRNRLGAPSLTPYFLIGTCVVLSSVGVHHRCWKQQTKAQQAVTNNKLPPP